MERVVDSQRDARSYVGNRISRGLLNTDAVVGHCAIPEHSLKDRVGGGTDR